MKKYRTLFLTDHLTHNGFNSFYTLVNACLDHPQCNQLYIGSRSNPKNQPFFNDFENRPLHLHRVRDKIQFSAETSIFEEQGADLTLDTFDLIVLRIPRPFDLNLSKHLLNNNPKSTFINHPIGMIETGNKQFLLQLESVCPPIKLCKTAQDLKSFSDAFPIVLKPLKAYGGKGVVKIEDNIVYDGNNSQSLEDYLKRIRQELINDGFLAMKFMKNVHEGDKRLIVANGKIVACSLRLPAKGNWLCNVAQGGRSEKTTVTKREKEIIDLIAPILLEKGVVMFGADTLVNDDGERVLSEINTMSVGGIFPAEQENESNISQVIIDEYFNYINKIHERSTNH